MKYVPSPPSIRRALAELVLIFVGITLALSFENWNGGRQQRRQEVKLLREMMADLEGTVSQAEGDLAVAEVHASAFAALLQAFDGTGGGEPESASHEPAFESLFDYGHLLVVNRSSYESIKSIGLDLISNDSLRYAVATYYELTLPRVVSAESDLRRLNETVVVPTLRSELTQTGAPAVATRQTQRGPYSYAPFVGVRPRRPEAFFARQDYAMLLREVHNGEAFIVTSYRAALEDGRALIRMVARESSAGD